MESLFVEDLLTELHSETVKRRQRNLQIQYGWGFLILLSLLTGTITFLRKGVLDTDLLMSLSLFVTCGAAAGMTSTHKNAARAVALLTDKRALGCLLETLDSGDKAIEAVVGPALRELLPQMTPEDAALLDTPQRQRLYALVRSSSDPALAEASLRALERIGTLEAIPHLDAVALSGQSDRIRDVAKQALAETRIRCARQIIEGTVDCETPAVQTLRRG